MDETKKFGRYEIVRPLGKGAMGVVYLCSDPQIGRTVAIKTVPLSMTQVFDQDEMRERLFKEAQAAGVLSHPNIVTIYDVGEEEQNIFIVMEYLEGEALSDIIHSSGSQKVQEGMSISDQLGGALDYAHSRGIIHRDVKPANIMRLPDGRFKLMDFGIARIFDSSMTQPGEIVGSPIYMSPEQIEGEELSGLSDLYSLGTVMFEVLTGYRPFDGDNFNSIVLAKFENRRPAITDLNSSLSPGLENFFEHALAINPTDRYKTGKEFAKALRVALTEKPKSYSYFGFKPLQSSPDLTIKTSSQKIKKEGDEHLIETVDMTGDDFDEEVKEKLSERPKQPAAASDGAAQQHFGLSTNILKAYSQMSGVKSQAADASVKEPKRTKKVEVELKERAADRLLRHTSKSKMQYREDIAVVARKLREDPENIEMLFRMARLQQRIENFNDAMNLLRRIVKKDYEFTQAYDAMGEIYFSLNKEDKAYSYWSLSEMVNDRQHGTLSEDNYYRLGKQLQQDGLLRGAIEVWEECLLMDPNNLACMKDLARYYLKLRDYPKSIEVHKSIVALDPNDAVAHRNLAVSCQNSGQYKEALEVWERALQLERKGKGGRTARRQISALKQHLKSSGS